MRLSPRRLPQTSPAAPAMATVLLVAFALSACQPVDEVKPTRRVTTQATVEKPITAPVVGLPETFSELIARAELRAREWQDEPQLGEVLVEIARDGSTRKAELTYLKANADRFLTVTVTASEVTDEQATLATLQLQPITARGMRELPPLPEETLAPDALASRARAALRRCGISGTPTQVRYSSGAPAAWDGRRWAQTPAWSATVSTARGAVVLDPVTAEPANCVEFDN